MCVCVCVCVCVRVCVLCVCEPQSLCVLQCKRLLSINPRLCAMNTLQALISSKTVGVGGRLLFSVTGFFASNQTVCFIISVRVVAGDSGSRECHANYLKLVCFDY